tara:strand:- start:191 stop:715 length:525 start_codon:yes stop_codon:yes gene_type:complete
MNFIIQQADQAIVKTVSAPKTLEPVFAKYQRMTLEKLDKSIIEAEGRYGEHARPYTDTKPSQNWKVVGKKEALVANETLEVWLKIGIEKVVIGQDDAQTLRMTPTSAIAWLTAMRAQIASLTLETGKDFHQVAIKQAKPKTAPKAEGMSDWKYNPSTDLYEAVSSAPSLTAVNS